jgi:hypothetical protein
MNNNDMRKITREFVEAILTCDIDDNDELLTEQMEMSMDTSAIVSPSPGLGSPIGVPQKITIYPESGELEVSMIENPQRRTWTIRFGDSFTISEIEEEDLQNLANLLSVTL